MWIQIRLYCPTAFITGAIPLSKATSPVFAALIRSTIWIANLTIVSTPPIPGLIHFDTVFKMGFTNLSSNVLILKVICCQRNATGLSSVTAAFTSMKVMTWTINMCSMSLFSYRTVNNLLRARWKNRTKSAGGDFSWTWVQFRHRLLQAEEQHWNTTAAQRGARNPARGISGYCSAVSAYTRHLPFHWQQSIHWKRFGICERTGVDDNYFRCIRQFCYNRKTVRVCFLIAWPN